MFLSKSFKAIIDETIGAVNKAFNTIFDQMVETIIKQQPKLRQAFDEVEEFHRELEILKNQGFPRKATYELKEKYTTLYETLHEENRLIRHKKINDFFRTYTNIDYEIQRAHTLERENEKKRVAYLLDHIDGKALDEAQKDAVVCDCENCLVIAGAGSGKTLTVAGKVAYLVKEKEIPAEEILLITYTADAAKEMAERVVNRLDIPVKVKTFHALGNEIIGQVEGHRSMILEQNKRILDTYFKEVIFQDEVALNQLIQFFGRYLHCPPHVENYNDLGEYYNSLKSLNLKTLKEMCEAQEAEKMTFQGEQVKSVQELIIANFLYLNGIQYNYEKPYEYQVSDETHRQYQPDFYLPEVKLYIEHFGVDRQGNASWLPDIENIKYQKDMIWKRNLHKQNGTKLYETYSFQFEEGDVLEILEKDLKAMGVTFKPKSSKEIYERLMAKESKHFKEFKKLMWTFLNLFKSHNYNIEQLEELRRRVNGQSNIFMRKRMLGFLTIFEGLLRYYEKTLQKAQAIDFNDMINKATEYVKQDKVNMSYRYIIIDEYQDIAYARYALVKAIKQKTGAGLMAVGDDWQSIYRFAGSDITLFTRFEKFFGMTEKIYIENTYRNSQQLIDIAGKFVMQNPLQIAKKLKSSKGVRNPIRIVAYGENIQKAFLYVLKQIATQTTSQQIMVLGRNSADIQLLQSNTAFYIEQSNKQIFIRSKDYPALTIRFSTVHKSKGLEADEVIILNCKNELLGFPNQLTDDPILDLVMTQGDYYLHGEERRLFYVALTRTKNHCYLLAPEENRSIFIKELINAQDVPVEHVEETQIYNEKITCPRCQSGILIKRKGLGKNFLGCSNFPFCDYKIKDMEVLKHPIRCELCGGYMVKRSSKYGDFYGCSNYPECRGKLRTLS